MKWTIISIIIALALIGGTIALSRSPRDTRSTSKSNDANNVSMEGDTQVIEITARGGYQPRRSVAKAGVPTIVRFKTNNTFDCSSSVRIASANISKSLPLTGTTDIDLGSPTVGLLNGSCGMGMYSFDIDFQ